MPIYEFYCADCHRILKFLARRVDTAKRPDCPRCGRMELERQVSLFAISKNRQQGGEDEFEPDIDESKLERAMEALASEADSVDEEDPRQLGRLVRRLYDATGVPLSPTVQEAIQRLEAGEDPDTVEESLGDALESEDLFASPARHSLSDLRRKLLPPQVDDRLYDL